MTKKEIGITTAVILGGWIFWCFVLGVSGSFVSQGEFKPVKPSVSTKPSTSPSLTKPAAKPSAKPSPTKVVPTIKPSPVKTYAPAKKPVVSRAPVVPSREPSAYYASCAEAPGPLYRNTPGYRSGLDRDGDGVACEG